MNEFTQLPALVRKAAAQLASAVTAAEVLEARDLASVAYDAAKTASRLARAKEAHDEIIVKAAHAQADAVDIECAAKRRLADEYDAAQKRGEVRGDRQRTASKPEAVGVAEIGLTHKQVHEARQIRDAEEADPGIVRRTLDERLANGEEPSRAAIRRAIGPNEPAQIDPGSLWLWGRLRDFERMGILARPANHLIAGMTQAMRADLAKALPGVRAFLDKLQEEIQ